MKIVFFGLSITSSWGNGHATTFRALIKALHDRGHEVTFFEKNLKWYASNRDLPAPEFCKVRIFESWRAERSTIHKELDSADVAVVGSYFPEGATVMDEVLDSHAATKAFYDIDTPITMAQLEADGETPYLKASQIAELDVYFSFTAGPLLATITGRFGAPCARPLYCSVDPAVYFRRQQTKRFGCDMSYMGTYAPDRQPKLEAWMNSVATQMPEARFVVAGPQYPRNIAWAQNVRHTKHLNPRWHPHLYSSSRFVLNITRRDMVLAGYSPSVRLFEAAACGATIISDNWPGLETFLSPGQQILLPASTRDVLTCLREMSEAEIRDVGDAAQAQVLQYHTNAQRALEFERAVEESRSRIQARSSDADSNATANIA
jgi:spore maturation protein CgeB